MAGSLFLGLLGGAAAGTRAARTRAAMATAARGTTGRYLSKNSCFLRASGTTGSYMPSDGSMPAELDEIADRSSRRAVIKPFFEQIVDCSSSAFKKTHP